VEPNLLATQPCLFLHAVQHCASLVAYSIDWTTVLSGTGPLVLYLLTQSPVLAVATGVRTDTVDVVVDVTVVVVVPPLVITVWTFS